MRKSKIGIFFDLDNESLKRYYPNKYYTQAWADIKRFMESRDFIHQQYSGYISNSFITKHEAHIIVKEMSLKFPWLKNCLKECILATVEKGYDLKEIVIEAWDNESQREDEYLSDNHITDEEYEDEMEL